MHYMHQAYQVHQLCQQNRPGTSIFTLTSLTFAISREMYMEEGAPTPNRQHALAREVRLTMAGHMDYLFTELFSCLHDESHPYAKSC